MHCRWCTAGDVLQVIHRRWCIEGEPLQVMHCRWCTAGDAPQVMHRKWCTEIQDQSDIWYDTSDLCIGSVGFGVSNCSGVLVVSPSNSKSRTDYWVLLGALFLWTISVERGGSWIRSRIKIVVVSPVSLHPASQLQKAKNIAPAAFLAKSISTKTRDSRHFQIRDKQRRCLWKERISLCLFLTHIFNRL